MSWMKSLTDPVHFSNLRYMSRSPAHYRASITNPREATSAMNFGKIVHAIFFDQPYVMWHGTRRGVAWDKFLEEHDEDLIVSASEYERARYCCDAIEQNNDALELLVGEAEVERNWNFNGRLCSARLDIDGERVVTELKTTSNAEPLQFVRGALRLYYHAQLAWYCDGVGKNEAAIVAVETAPPFAVQTFRLTERALEAGRKLYHLWMERLLVCEQSNSWPSYCQSIVPFDVPDFDQTLIIDGEEVDAA